MNEDFNRLKKELLKAKHKYMESNRDVILMQTQTHTNHTRETNLMKELTSLRETLATIEQKNGIEMKNVMQLHAASMKTTKLQSSSSLKLLQNELEPLQTELKRLSPIETELMTLRSTNETMSTQIIQG